MPTRKSKVTTNHDEIRRWAEERGGQPAMVKGTGGDGQVGIIRIDFPGYAEENLEPISWDQFFDKFENSNLALVYQETTRGQKSNFNKLVSRESVSEETGEKVAPPRRRRKEAERAGAAPKRAEAKRAAPKRAAPKRAAPKREAAKKAEPRRATRKTAVAERGERRAPSRAAARTAKKPTGPSTKGGAKKSPRGTTKRSTTRKSREE